MSVQHAEMELLCGQEAEEQLDEGKVGFVEASALTHKQVLEMAVAEASRRMHEASRHGFSRIACCCAALACLSALQLV